MSMYGKTEDLSPYPGGTHCQCTVRPKIYHRILAVHIVNARSEGRFITVSWRYTLSMYGQTEDLSPYPGGTHCQCTVRRKIYHRILAVHIVNARSEGRFITVSWRYTLSMYGQTEDLSPYPGGTHCQCTVRRKIYHRILAVQIVNARSEGRFITVSWRYTLPMYSQTEDLSPYPGGTHCQCTVRRKIYHRILAVHIVNVRSDRRFITAFCPNPRPSSLSS